MNLTSLPKRASASETSHVGDDVVKGSRHRCFGRTTIYMVLSILGGGSILPLLWMLSSSINSSNAFYVYPPQLIPAEPTLDNYSGFFERDGWRYFLNTAFVAIAVTTIVAITSTMAGYSLAKLPFRGRNVVFTALISGLMIPWEITIIPLFVIIVEIGWVNTYQGIILPLCATPLGIFIMRQFMLSIPRELIDAARVDGASEFGIFLRIVVPVSKPAIAALCTVIFLSSWSAFLWPLIASSRSETRTLPVAIALFQQQYSTSYGLMMAGASVTFIPALLTFLAFQRYFVQGITMSGFKG